jgi:Uma2 family endonuclease
MTLVTPKRFTIAEYHRLIDLGFLSEDDRVELIRGELMQMAAKGTLHSVCNTKLFGELSRLVGDRAVVRGQEPIILPTDSEPEPDIAIARGLADDYLSAHPQPENILLVIEVSDSSLDYDQNTKLALYAEDGISHYWIVNLVANQLECYSQPYQDAQERFGYRFKQIALRSESVILPGFPDLYLELDRVFPGLGANA